MSFDPNIVEAHAKKLQPLGTLDDAIYFMTPDLALAHILADLKAFVAAN